jgi:hypothetical protein
LNHGGRDFNIRDKFEDVLVVEDLDSIEVKLLARVQNGEIRNTGMLRERKGFERVG